MTGSASDADWLAPLAEAIRGGSGRGGFLWLLPSYRPDLVRSAAAGLGLRFLDFRAEVLAPLGWQAGRLPLTELWATVAREVAPGGLLLHNAEALLAAKPVAERRAWIAAFLDEAWPTPCILPLVLFGDLADRGERVVVQPPESLPPETLLIRLWSMR